MLEGEFRALTDIGSFRINGYATYGTLVPLVGGSDSHKRFRGYLESAGNSSSTRAGALPFGPDRHRSHLHAPLRHISRDDRLRSTFNLERIGGNAICRSQDGRRRRCAATGKGQQPVALPVITTASGSPTVARRQFGYSQHAGDRAYCRTRYAACL